MPPPPLLEARALAMWRGERCLFRDLNLVIEPGRALHVRGPNGCGKTTLLRILCGLLAAEDGELRVQGEAVHGADPRLRAAVGYLGHADGVKQELRVTENLLFAAAIAGVKPAPDPVATLQRMRIASLAELETRLLSAGQRRRLAIGRLIAGAYRLWVLDEPFTALDGDGVALLTALMEDALDRGVGIIFSSHQPAGVDTARLDSMNLADAAP